MNDRESAGSRAGGGDAHGGDPERIVERVAEYDEGLAEEVREVVDDAETDEDGEFEFGFDDPTVEDETDHDESDGEESDEPSVAELAAELEDKEDRIADLKDRLDDRESEIEDLKSRLKRKQADFENFKKRKEREQDRIRQRATEDLVERLLEVRDDLNRALDNDHPDVESLKGGIEMVLRKFDRVLDDENVSEIDPEPGAELDPQRHEVMMQADSDHPEGTIAEVYQPGYEMADEVIRAARVTVSTGESPDDGDDE